MLFCKKMLSIIPLMEIHHVGNSWNKFVFICKLILIIVGTCNRRTANPCDINHIWCLIREPQGRMIPNPKNEIFKRNCCPFDISNMNIPYSPTFFRFFQVIKTTHHQQLSAACVPPGIAASSPTGKRGPARPTRSSAIPRVMRPREWPFVTRSGWKGGWCVTWSFTKKKVCFYRCI